MRQFFFGILAAGALVWGYQHFYGTPTDGTVQGGGLQLGPADAGGSRTASPVDAILGAGTGAAPSPGEATRSVDALVGALESADATAIDAAWVALAGPMSQSDRSRLAKQLQPRDASFVAHLAALGTRNAFLHSPEGRQAAETALAALVSDTDEARCLGGSQLLSLCLRGRIELADREARGCVNSLYAQHRAIVERWLCDPANVTRARSHTIEPGKGLAVAASKFRREGLLVDAGTLAVLNRIHNPNLVQAGQKIKVPVDPIRAVLEKRSYGLAVYVGDFLLRMYWVGHGANDKTPITEFTVVEKQAQPQWTAPNGRVYPYGHPENILGEYFLKFQHDTYKGFGAHGTTQPETIGTMSSAGCIRMLDEDIDELYRVLPRGAKVEIRAAEWGAAPSPR